MTIENVIAIVGCQRSGTTLTGQILGAHPACVLFDEGDGLYRWFHARAGNNTRHDRIFAAVAERAAAKYRNSSERFVHCNGLMDVQPHVKTLVLKAPNLTYACDELAAFDLPVRLVYPVRDPRSVVASMTRLRANDFVGSELRLLKNHAKMADARPDEYAALASDAAPPWIRRAMMWKLKSGRAPDYRELALPVFQFRYEDLVRSRRTIDDLLDHCKLDASAEVLSPHCAYVGRGPGQTDRTRAIDQDSLDSWSVYLDSSKADDVMLASNPLAAALGYQ